MLAILGVMLLRASITRVYVVIPWSAALAGGRRWILAAPAPDERQLVLAAAVLAVCEIAIVAAIGDAVRLVLVALSHGDLHARWCSSIGRSTDTMAHMPPHQFGAEIAAGVHVLSRVVPNLHVYVPARALLLGHVAGHPGVAVRRRGGGARRLLLDGAPRARRDHLPQARLRMTALAAGRGDRLRGRRGAGRGHGARAGDRARRGGRRRRRGRQVGLGRRDLPRARSRRGARAGQPVAGPGLGAARGRGARRRGAGGRLDGAARVRRDARRGPGDAGTRLGRRGLAREGGGRPRPGRRLGAHHDGPARHLRGDARRAARARAAGHLARSCSSRWRECP